MLKKLKNYLGNQSRGQTSLMIILLLAVGIGLSLALSSQVTTDIRISKTQEESARAFAAAEAGLEKSLYQWQTTGVTAGTLPEIVLDSNTTAEVTVEDVGGGQSFSFPSPTDADDYQIIWLADHNSDGSLNEGSYYGGNNLRLCWDTAAVEAVLFYKDATGDYRTYRWALDPSGRGNFSTPSGSACGVLGSGVSEDLSLSGAPSYSSPLFLAVKVYYSSTSLGAEGDVGTTLPIQGKKIISAGKVDQGGGTVVSRKLEIFQTWDLPPLVFLEPLFSSGGVSLP
jgi:hypothetical protein